MTRGNIHKLRLFSVMAENMPQFTSVYHSLDSILNFFRTPQFSQVEQVQRLLHIFNENYNQDVQPSSQHLHPFIVVEGLDGSGKSTQVKKLKTKVNGQILSTPPSCLLGLRNWFDQQPSDVRRAYYSLGNYIVGQQVERVTQACPVVMDRYWHTTASYAIADEVRDKNISLPPSNDPLYEWPKDLTKPELVLFFKVDERFRVQRHHHHNTTNTPEEQELAANAQWRNNVIEAHNRIWNVRMEIVDANRYSKIIPRCMELIEPLL